MPESTKRKSTLQIDKNSVEPSEPKLKATSIMKIKGKDAATYEGMLDFGHQHGIAKFGVDLIQAPSKENEQTAICKAILETTDGRLFSDIGDANPSNTPKGCSEHYIRMASTRAKTRVLCDAFNIKSVIHSGFGQDDHAIDAEYKIVEGRSISNMQVIESHNPISIKQVSMINGLASNNNLTAQEVENISLHKFNKHINSLTTKEAHQLIKHLERL